MDFDTPSLWMCCGLPVALRSQAMTPLSACFYETFLTCWTKQAARRESCSYTYLVPLTQSDPSSHPADTEQEDEEELHQDYVKFNFQGDGGECESI